jgi:hypothetical protein
MILYSGKFKKYVASNSWTFWRRKNVLRLVRDWNWHSKWSSRSQSVFAKETIPAGRSLYYICAIPFVTTLLIDWWNLCWRSSQVICLLLSTSANWLVLSQPVWLFPTGVLLAPIQYNDPNLDLTPSFWSELESVQELEVLTLVMYCDGNNSPKEKSCNNTMMKTETIPSWKWRQRQYHLGVLMLSHLWKAHPPPTVSGSPPLILPLHPRNRTHIFSPSFKGLVYRQRKPIMATNWH